jgi:hypothetical protein
VSQNQGAVPQARNNPAAQRSTGQRARDEAGNVGQAAREAGTSVAATAADQAKQVASETGRQARGLLGDVRDQAREQAAAQQHKTVEGLHTLAAQLDEMAAKSGESGIATKLAQEASHRLHGAASWLERRQPDDLLNEIRDFARRRPTMFLLGAAAAGVVAGRLTRGLTAQAGRGQAASAAPPAGETGWRPDGPVPAGEQLSAYGYGPATGHEPAPGYAPPGSDPSAGREPAATDSPRYGGAAAPRPGASGRDPGISGDERTYRRGRP